jgi:mRNA interferase RelE/StbE
MSWNLRYSKKAEKQISKLDSNQARIIVAWLKKHLNGCDNPRFTGKPLGGALQNLWRYRIGDYRVLAEIKDAEIVILVLEIGHRSKVYKRADK